MKTIGSWTLALASSRWRSRPLIPGSRTSRTRHPGASRRLLFRNSSAEAKVSTRVPADLMRLFRASRTSRSSSTTKTTQMTSHSYAMSLDSSLNSAACVPRAVIGPLRVVVFLRGFHGFDSFLRWTHAVAPRIEARYRSRFPNSQVNPPAQGNRIGLSLLLTSGPGAPPPTP